MLVAAMWRDVDISKIRRKLAKLRRDPELFVYEYLRPRIEARPRQAARRVRQSLALPETASTTTRALDADLDRFTSDLEAAGANDVVFIFSGTTFIQGVRANRPIRLAKVFRRLGAAVVFSFFRWRTTDEVPPYTGDLIFQTPIDYTMSHIEALTRLGAGCDRKLLVVGFPFPPLMAPLDRFTAHGWSTIYDCRDDWELFHQVGQAPWYLPAAEAYAIAHTDVTCCVSKTLVDKMGSIVPGRRVLLSPNAYDDQFLSPDYQRRPSETPIAGYFGHLTEAWFDWPALLDVARLRPAIHFEIIGHSAPKNLTLPANVTLLGSKTHPEICRIASRWNAGIIPFKIGPLADAVDPIKIYEYLALGLPTVSFRMPQIDGYPYTTTTLTVPAFARALDEAVATRCDSAEISRFLDANTWEGRAREMLQWVESDTADPFRRLLVGA